MLVVYCYNTILLLFYQRESIHIGYKHFWDFYGTIGLLEILNQRDHDTRRGNSCGIERMGVFYFPVVIFVANIEPPSLKIMIIRDAGNLSVPLLLGHPEFCIIRFDVRTFEITRTYF